LQNSGKKNLELWGESSGKRIDELRHYLNVIIEGAKSSEDNDESMKEEDGH
jgi:hypothetical protein